MTTLLSTESLRKQFGGVLAVNDVNARFNANRLRSIIGPNGAGKTTLINLITGRLPSTSGRGALSGPGDHQQTGPSAGENGDLQNVSDHKHLSGFNGV